jgi:hypothetical protein
VRIVAQRHLDLFRRGQKRREVCRDKFLKMSRQQPIKIIPAQIRIPADAQDFVVAEALADD